MDVTRPIAMALGGLLAASAIRKKHVAGQVKTFLTIGDFGGAALGDWENETVYKVAEQLGLSAEEHSSSFVVNTGDNFYYCGIQNTSDFQVKADWIDPYNAESLLRIPWFTALGNHEYGYNVSAQLELDGMFPNWVLPARYYSRRISLDDGDNFLSLVVLDTNPCLKDYRSVDRAGWDPCGTEYPTCSIDGSSDMFEGDCHFNRNILSQDCEAQRDWLRRTLAAVPERDWLVVVGHHPADEVDVFDLVGMLADKGGRGFDLYLNGHAHVLTHYTMDHSGAYVTSGAGAMVETHDQLGGTPGQDLTRAKVDGRNYTGRHHSYQVVFTEKTAGFTLHTFSDDYSELRTDFLSHSGEVLHTFSVRRGEGPEPTPSPTPGPIPEGSKCCFARSAACSEGNVCCRSGCAESADPASCTYTKYGCGGEYGKKHRCRWDGDVCLVGGKSSVENARRGKTAVGAQSEEL